MRTTTLGMIGILTALTLAGPGPGQAQGAFLGDLPWPDAEQRVREAPLVVVPFGAGAKEHGLHLPLNSDAVVMEYLCRQAVDSTDVIVAPPILHGWFPPFRGWPGTEVSDPAVFRQYAYQVARSLVSLGAKRIVFLNTGISTATGLPLAIAARELRVETGTPTLVVSWDDLETEELESLVEQRAGGHADEVETSIHLYLQPERVYMERATPAYGTGRQRYPGYAPGLFSRDKKDPAFSETGHFGDPTLATKEKGKEVLRIMTAEWLKALRGFATAPLRSP